jgi:DNA-damage-inducible protein D
MDSDLQQVKTFEQLKQLTKSGAEFWSARDIMPLLGYKNWESFKNVIEKAIVACKNSGEQIERNFFVPPRKSDGGRPREDYILSRFACYLVAQNGDARIPEIAGAQNYFAVQTRRQEMTVERQEELERVTARHKLAETEKEFARELMQRSIDGIGLGQIKSRGDKVLFGGNTTNEMKRRYAVPKNRPLADFLPTITLKAKDLAAEITTFNTQKKDLKSTESVAVEHEQNNRQLRGVLNQRGIIPETLTPADDVKKLERRIIAEDKKKLKPAEKPLKIDDSFDNTLGKIANAGK